jgi:hypothetical protein
MAFTSSIKFYNTFMGHFTTLTLVDLRVMFACRVAESLFLTADEGIRTRPPPMCGGNGKKIHGVLFQFCKI